jgi:hypothetical protein
VWGTNGTSRYIANDRGTVVLDRESVSESNKVADDPKEYRFTVHFSKTYWEFHRGDASNVLNHNPARPHGLDDAAHRRPEVAVIFRASTLPGCGEWLAGESPTDDVNMLQGL